MSSYVNVVTNLTKEFLLNNNTNPLVVLRTVSALLIPIVKEEFDKYSSLFNCPESERNLQYGLQVTIALNRIAESAAIKLQKALCEGLLPNTGVRIDWDDSSTFKVELTSLVDVLPASGLVH